MSCALSAVSRVLLHKLTLSVDKEVVAREPGRSRVINLLGCWPVFAPPSRAHEAL